MTTIVGASVGANLALIALDMLWARSARERSTAAAVPAAASSVAT